MHGQVTGLAYAIYYPVLAAIGVPGNLVTIVILSRGRCGLSRCITRYLVGMAVTDLLVIITAVILNRISVIYFPVLFLSTTPVCSLKIALIYIARDSSVWLTVAFTVDRFVAICCQNLKIKYCTKKTAAVVIGTVCGVSCVKNFPWYFVYEPLYIINGVPWYCNIKLSFYSEILWTAFDWIDRILNPCAPFLLMVALNTLTVRNILAANKSRRRLQARNIRENQSDSEMESRRKSIILLFTISGSFILLWMTYVVNFLHVRFTNSNYSTGSTLSNPRFILQESGNMLQLLSCCTNTCIYAGTQSKFREEFKNGLKYPLNLIIKFAKL
ncbi:probable G-protein coupled receptor 139 [Heterodontus francisci]|uniref:probable G-protein coupled receptor 139 n=1 Tax=Heterodontus francisci TaxID=7792 RepID=UPI00355C05E1